MMLIPSKLRMALLAGGVVLAGAAAAPGSADARVFIGFGFGVPFYAPYYPYYYGPPAVVYPPPAAYGPPPAGYAAPPPSYSPPPPQSWYYCDDPQGYYPSIQNCNREWRQVPATPAAQ